MGTVRFLLALSVVVGHSASVHLFGVHLLDAATAVQCFYMISGFLITMILNERKGYLSLSNFYLSRYFRLWPAYFVVAFASLILVNWQVMTVQLPAMATWPSIAFIWFANLTLFFQDWFLFIRFDHGSLIATSNFLIWPNQAWPYMLAPQCWSLGVELTFYAIAPFVCRRWQHVAALFAFGLGLRALLAFFVPITDPWTYRFAPTEMMMFAAGGLAYFAGRNLCPRYPGATKIACIVSLIAIGAFVVAEETILQIVGPWYALATFLMINKAPALVVMAFAAAPLFYATRNNRFDQLLGELSYPMYICHFLIMVLMTRYKLMSPDNALYVAIVIGVSLALFYCVTVPTDRFRRRFGARMPPSLRVVLGDEHDARAAVPARGA